MAQVGVAGDGPAAAILGVAGMTAGDDDLELASRAVRGFASLSTAERRAAPVDRPAAPPRHEVHDDMLSFRISLFRFSLASGGFVQ